MSRRVMIWIAAGIVAILAVGGGSWWAVSSYRATHGPECTVPRPADSSGGAAPSKSEPLGLDAVQLQHASTINAVGLARGEQPRARVIAVAAAWQESSLRNIDSGDRDSLGLFQQRPSQGWGDPDQILDPVYAANQFYDHLAKVRDWQDMSLTDAAQAVQRSGFPDAYAQWEWDAQTLVDQLSGQAPIALSCRRGAHASTAATPRRDVPAGADGTTPALADLLSAAHAELGAITVDGIGAAGRQATVSVDLPTASVDEATRALAAWLVAHSTSFGITEVAADGQVWSEHKWQPSQTSPGAGSVQVSVDGAA